jgi:demethylmenaquinone methyltransferase/2-methoxy-6-polyprenyl-1,4-benzoquinol methylase
MFSRIAGCYDVNNRLHSLGRDRIWRRSAARLAAVRPRESALDVACGTGELTRLLRAAGAARVVGVDFCEEMLRIARAKSAGVAGLDFVLADAHALPVGDATFDVVTIAFGLRNLAEPAVALREFHRVLRTGGRLIVLEFCPAGLGLGGAVLRWFTRAVLPRTAGALSGQPNDYRYLHASIRSFMTPEALAAALGDAGFTNVTTHPMTFATVAVHRGEKRRDGWIVERRQVD